MIKAFVEQALPMVALGLLMVVLTVVGLLLTAEVKRGNELKDAEIVELRQGHKTLEKILNAR